MTDFSNVCDILGELYATYKDQKEFKDFLEFNDLGLPLAYMVRENLAVPSDDGAKYIVETWDLFIASLGIEDTGFETLNEILDQE
jgi:hypothetical protein